MARISLVICDLCKEKIEDEAIFGIVLTSRDEMGTNGEICKNCFRSLLSRLKSSPETVLQTRLRTQGGPNNSPQSLRCIGVQDGGSGVVLGVSDAVSHPEGSKELSDGEFKVPSQAHTIPREKSSCNHDRKSFADNGEVICLECSELLGNV